MYKGEHKKMNFFCINIYRIKLFANDAKMKYIKRYSESPYTTSWFYMNDDGKEKLKKERPDIWSKLELDNVI